MRWALLLGLAALLAGLSAGTGQRADALGALALERRTTAEIEPAGSFEDRLWSIWVALSSLEADHPAPPLTLQLYPSPDVCGAVDGIKRILLSSRISGGVPPYTLIVDGQPVDELERPVLLDCGLRPSDPPPCDPNPKLHQTFTVVATDSRGMTATAELQVAVAEPPQRLAPGAVLSRALTGTAVRLSWEAAVMYGSPVACAYELRYQATDWDATTWPDSWTAISEAVEADATEYLHDGLDPDRRYRYQVRARNDIGAGDWSRAFPHAGARPGAPALSAQTAASGSIALNWIAGSARATHWEYRQRSDNGSWGSWTQIVGTLPLTTSHTVTGLTEDARYYFQLRAVRASGAGPASAIASAVAGLTPTVLSDREPLYYDDLDSAGGAVRPGSYAFLTDADDLTSGATTFTEVSSAEALLLNTKGYVGRYYGSVLATAQVGDRITWLPNSGCWYHYRITAIPRNPPAPARKLFRVALAASDPCGSAAPGSRNAKIYFDETRGNTTTFGWNNPPSEPHIGPDGVRILPSRYAVEGGHTYRLNSRTSIVVDVPLGMQLIRARVGLSSSGGLYATYVDAASGGDFSLYASTGDGVDYYVPTPEGETEPPADVVARFEALIASIREQPLPPPQAPGAPRSTSASEGVRLHWTAVTATPAVSAYELQYQATEWDNTDWPDRWTAVGGRIGANETTYLHRDLDPDRRYRYRLRARNSIDLSDWSLVSPSVGAQPLPGAPTLLASTAASGAVALSWITGPSSITKWEYRRQQEGGSWGDWTGIANADASTASHIVSDLTEDVRYSFQLRAVNAAGPGPASAASSAVAGLTPTTLSDREEFSYDTLSLAGGLARPGTYAFLTDADDLASSAMTLAEMSTAAALLFNTSDLPGGDYADVLAALQVGDPIRWSPFIHDFCWYDYRVTEILADPPPPSRKLFRIALDEEKTCGFRVHFRDLPATFGWNRPVREPDVGPDGLRVIPPLTPGGLPGHAIEGGRTYRLHEGISLSPIVIDVPAGMTLSSNFYGVFLDEASGTYLMLDPLTGKNAEHVTRDGASPTSAELLARFKALIAIDPAAPVTAAIELVARFQAMIASIRVVPLPGAGQRPGAPTLAAQTAASGSAALSWSAGPPGATRWEYRRQQQGGGWSEWTPIVGSDAFTASHTVSGLSEDMRYHFQVRAANTGGAGSPSATAVAVAGLTPTVPSERETLSYDNLDSAGGAVRPGSYAFLTDADDLTSGATTFAEASSAVALLLNTSGDTSRYAGILAAVQVGDRITWRPYRACSYHYRVTEILPNPPAPARKLLRVGLEAKTTAPCDASAARLGNAKAYFDKARDTIATIEVTDAMPNVGPDGIRLMPSQYPVEGGHTYRLVGHRGPAPIVVDIPAGMRFIYVGGILYTDGRVTGTYVEVVSGGIITLSPYDVEDAYYEAATPEGETEPPADVVARFEALIASVRKVPLP